MVSATGAWGLAATLILKVAPGSTRREMAPSLPEVGAVTAYLVALEGRRPPASLLNKTAEPMALVAVRLTPRRPSWVALVQVVSS
jgi:hypothetical protein